MTEALAPAIACSRMYNLSPKISGLWDALFGWLGRRSGVDLEIIAHAAPAPLSELWSRPDMGAVFMCGYPFSTMPEAERPIALAAPISTEAWAQGGPFYASHIVVAQDSPIGLADLMSARWGWTVRDSQSGYHAPRAFLAAQPGPGRSSEAVGPLLNPKGIVDAILSGRIDIGAIDAYAYQLLAKHEPDMVAGLRVVATTEPTPVPLLVAARQQPEEIVSALRHALLQAHLSEEAAGILSALGLSGFAAPDPSAYDQLPERARKADLALGAPW